ncbi:phage tail tube protein (plasmid) [Apilactobacillus apisilvae]|uniref:Phage tail tube protein n=1 Tax=Apilactobacillus apisilvae TaxID=2923364 RepID=A0ABY4PJ55_9LACO|nr:phage tail tube protein [Apilactobacillus apisilvae]UQS85865.1 phage tail tube protein [Apilactobacillus apisilvae]
MADENLDKILNAKDTISLKEGKGFMTTDDGKNIPLMGIKKLKAKISKKKEDVPTLGSRWKQKKTTGIEGTGSIEDYTLNSNWIKYALPYIENGEDFFFSIVGVIEDKTSSAGKQTVTLKNVNMDDIQVLDIEADDGVMSQESDFSFVGVHLDQAFDGVK